MASLDETPLGTGTGRSRADAFADFRRTFRNTAIRGLKADLLICDDITQHRPALDVAKLDMSNIEKRVMAHTVQYGEVKHHDDMMDALLYGMQDTPRQAKPAPETDGAFIARISAKLNKAKGDFMEMRVVDVLKLRGNVVYGRGTCMMIGHRTVKRLLDAYKVQAVTRKLKAA